MNIDGSNVVQLTNDQNVSSPAWLPDGSKVVFGRVAPNTQVELWTINPDGSGKTFKRNLEPYAISIGPLYLAWSPLANIYTFTGLKGLYIADDVNPAVNTLAPDGLGSSWAPDGRSILVSGWDRTQFEINPDGSNRRNVPPGGVLQSPNAISPDGKFIAGGLRDTNNETRLVTRDRAGTPTTFTWAPRAYTTDWSRVPKNCYASMPQGGGEVLAGDVDFYAAQCAIAVMPDGGVHGVLQQAIAVGTDQRLYYRLLKSDPFGGQPTWTRFAPVPGAGGNPNGIPAKKIAIAASKDGSAQMVIINAADNLVYHAMRYANGTWSGFTALDGTGGASNFAARDVAITIGGSTPTTPGNAQVIANGLVWGDLYHRVRWPDGSWTPFAPISPDVTTHEIALAVAEDGNTNVLAMTTLSDGSQGRIMQALRYASGYWTGWVTVGMPNGTTLSASSDVAVTRTLSGTAQLMFTDSAGNVLLQERPSPNISEAWQTQVPNVTIANTVGRGVSISAGSTPNSSSQLLLTRTFPQ